MEVEKLIFAYRQVLQWKCRFFRTLGVVTLLSIYLFWMGVSGWNVAVSVCFVLCIAAYCVAVHALFLNPERMRTAIGKAVKFDNAQAFMAEIPYELSEPDVRHYEDTLLHVYVWNTRNWLIIFSRSGSIIARNSRVKSIQSEFVPARSGYSILIDFGGEAFNLICDDDYEDAVKAIKRE